MAELPDAEEIDAGKLLDMYLAGEIDLICVLGPTASGKTRYAVHLAKEIDRLLAVMPAAASGLCDCSDVASGSAVSGLCDGPVAASGPSAASACAEGKSGGRRRAEILSADSRQVYRGMDIGTGKDLDEYGDVPFHLIDIADAGTKYNIFEYQRDFENAYKEIRDRGNIPVLCGGSGLYIEAATCGYSLPEVPADQELRAELEKYDTETLVQRLASLRPLHNTTDYDTRKRLIRALEIAIYEAEHPAPRSSYLPKNTYYIGTLVSRDERNAKIDRRLDARLGEGMVEEVGRLLESGVAPEDLIYYGLEYKFVTLYLTGRLTYDGMRSQLATAIHQFAKRQMTWFRGMERRGINIHWTDARALGCSLHQGGL